MQRLSEIELVKQAPSIFSQHASENTSGKYALIPTIECVRGLEKAGFYPVKVQESRCRNADNKPYAKHLIRFRKEGTLEKGGNIPEIVMVNSHNGTCSYQLKAGIYRVVCTNGLIVGNDLFYRSVRHQGNVIDKVIDSCNEIIEIVPKAIEIAGKWQEIKLSGEQKKIYAESALLLKYDQESNIMPEKLLTPRRVHDQDNNLWTTFNMVQEHLIRGGIRYFDRKAERRGKTRAVNSVNENSRINIALWNLTEKNGKTYRINIF